MARIFLHNDTPHNREVSPHVLSIRLRQPYEKLTVSDTLRGQLCLTVSRDMSGRQGIALVVHNECSTNNSVDSFALRPKNNLNHARTNRFNSSGKIHHGLQPIDSRLWHFT